MNSEAFTPALVVVDFQEDFCPPHGSLAVTNGRDIAPAINELMALPFVSKIATMDWHTQDHVSFASNHTAPNNKPFESVISVKNPHNASESEDVRLWPDHCLQNSFGSELLSEFNSSTATIVKKGQDPRTEMFSAFRDTYQNPCVNESELATTLRKASTTHVYVVGIATDFCVKHTALHAADDGYKTYVVRQATKAVDQTQTGMQALEQELASRGISFIDIDSEEVKAVQSGQLDTS